MLLNDMILEEGSVMAISLFNKIILKGILMYQTLRKTCFISLLIIPVSLLVSSSIVAENAVTTINTPSMQIKRTSGEIKVDGLLDDLGWKSAAVADNFYETNPGDNIKPPVETKAFVTYDDKNLYVAIVAYADPKKVRASMCQRDQTPGDDNVGFILDTYGDGDWGYVFYVNRYGIQYDALTNSSFSWDVNYDLIWESAGQLTDSGYQVEIAVPFSSLRFPNQPKQNWKMDFVRFHEREVSYSIDWCPDDRNETCNLCQIGNVEGIENVKPGKGIEIIPALTGFQSGMLQSDNQGNLFFDNSDFDGEVSLSAKYSINSSSTFEIAVNPDFSQVESDANQIDVNTTTALSFPEKRPFFQEGSDLFNTAFDVVYTRSINDPIFAAKATARVGRSSIAYLGAYDEHSPVIIPFEEFSSSPIDLGKSISNIIRLRQSFGENSRIGFLATDRRYEIGGSGSALSLDGEMRFSKSISFNWQAVASRTDEPDDTTLTENVYKNSYINDSLIITPSSEFLIDDKHTAAFDGESFWGDATLFELSYDPRDFSASILFYTINPTLRFDNGYQPYNSEKELQFSTYYKFRFTNGFIESLTPTLVSSKGWYNDGRDKGKAIQLSTTISLRWNQTNVHPSYSYKTQFYAGKQFDNLWSSHICFGSSPSKYVSFGGGINYGDAIARRARVVGRQTQSWLWIDMHPVDQLYIENTFDWINSKEMTTDEILYDGFWARTSLNYQYNRELSLRCVVQYDDSQKTWDIDPLLTYRINPFTLFYIGTTYDYEKIDGLNKKGTAYVSETDEIFEHNKLTARQFFVKLQYLFQL